METMTTSIILPFLVFFPFLGAVIRSQTDFIYQTGEGISGAGFYLR